MSVSRISKMIFEVSKNAESIEEIEQSRKVDFQILVRHPQIKKNELFLLTTVELAIRSFKGKINVVLHSSEDHLIRSLLDEKLFEIEKDFGCSGRVQIISVSDNNLPTIRIGVIQGPGVGVDALGWVAGINTHFDENIPAEVPAITFAVSCGFARVFKSSLLGEDVDQEPWKFDVLKMSTVEEAPNAAFENVELNLGYLALLGAGAIGCGFCYVLKHSGYSARLDLIDSDRYEEPNQETSLLIGQPDAVAIPEKSIRLCEKLNCTKNLIISPYVERIDSSSSLLSVKRDVFICGVDNVETRLELDKVNSPWLINGGLGGSRLDSGHVLCTRHAIGDKTLSETYRRVEYNAESTHRSIPIEFEKDDCSRISYEAVSIAAPFVALACGSLLVALCVQRALGICQECNYLKVDLFSKQSSFYKKKALSKGIENGKPLPVIPLSI